MANGITFLFYFYVQLEKWNSYGQYSSKHFLVLG